MSGNEIEKSNSIDITLEGSAELENSSVETKDRIRINDTEVYSFSTTGEESTERTDSLYPPEKINFSDAKNANEAYHRYEDQINKLNKENDLHEPLVPQGADFMDRIEITNDVNYLKKTFLRINFGTKAQDVYHVMYKPEGSDEPVLLGYFENSQEELMKLGGFLTQLYDKALKGVEGEEMEKKNAIKEMVITELEHVAGHAELAALKNNITEYAAIGTETYEERTDINKTLEKDLKKSNKEQAKYIKQRVKVLNEFTHTVTLEVNEATVEGYFRMLEEMYGEAESIMDRYNDASVDSEQTNANLDRLKAEFVMKVCEIKYYIDNFEIAGNIRGNYTVNFNKKIGESLIALGYEKGRKNRNIKKVMKIVEATAELNQPGTHGRRKRKAERKIKKFLDNLDDSEEFVRTVSAGSGLSEGMNRNGASSSNRTTRMEQMHTLNNNNRNQPVYLSTDHYSNLSIDMTPAEDSDRRGRDEGLNKSDGIERLLDQEGNIFERIDLTKIPENKLIAYYHKLKESVSSTTPRSEKTKFYNVSFAIMQRIVEHGFNERLIQNLGGGDKRAGHEELQAIFKHVFFADNAFKEKVRAMFWHFKNKKNNGGDIAEFEHYAPDRNFENDDILLEIAFLRALPKKYHDIAYSFEKHTDGNKSNVYPDTQKVSHLVEGLGVDHLASAVEQGIGVDYLRKKPSTSEVHKGSGITGPGGVFDRWNRVFHRHINKQNRSGKTKDFVKGIGNGANKIGKIAYKGAELVALGTGLFKLGRGVFKAVGTLIGSGGKGFWKELGDGLKGGAIGLGVRGGLKLADNKLKSVKDTASEVLGFDRAGNKLREQTNAVMLNEIPKSDGIDALIGGMSMSAIIDNNIIFNDASGASPGNTFVNLSALSDEQLRARPPMQDLMRDETQRTRLKVEMGEYLLENYGMDATMLETLSSKYPDTSLKELLDRFEQHKGDPEFAALSSHITVDGGVNPWNHSGIEYANLYFLSPTEFETKKAHFAFIAQQKEKFTNTDTLKGYASANGLAFPEDLSGNSISANDYINKLLKTEDNNGVSVSSFAEKLFGKLVSLDPSSPNAGDKQKEIIGQYFKALYAGSRNKDLLVLNSPSSPPTSLWTVDGSNTPEGFGNYFHNTLATSAFDYPYATLGTDGSTYAADYKDVLDGSPSFQNLNKEWSEL